MRWAWPRKIDWQLPSVYVLIKRKKMWEAARSIIMYHRFFGAKILKVIGRLLLEMTAELLGHRCFNCPTITSLMEKLRQWNIDFNRLHSQLPGSTVDFDIAGDDLVGFFPSMEQDKMMRAAERLLEMHCAKKNCQPTDLVMSVSASVKCPSFSGRRQTEERHKPFYLEFLLPLLRWSLTASIVLVDGQVKRQFRGGTIGSPVSPAWLVLGVSLDEYDFQNTLRGPASLRGKYWQCLRYVDNRFLLQVKVDDALLGPKLLYDKNFYGQAVILEEEPRNRLVGSEIIYQRVHNRAAPQIEARYLVEGFPDTPTDVPENSRWKYRTPSSSCTRHSLMSAFTARLHLGLRQSFPVHRQFQCYSRLVYVYLSLGYPPNWLISALKDFMRKHPTSGHQNWMQNIVQLARKKDLPAIHKLGF